jgi:hypothetical protein
MPAVLGGFQKAVSRTELHKDFERASTVGLKYRSEPWVA